MKIKNRKWLACVCLLLIGSLLFVGCDGDTTKNGDDDALSEQTIGIVPNNGNDTTSETSETTEQTVEKVQLDAFGDLKLSVEGISPRCTVVLDNSDCSEEVRSSVTYATDKPFYANGEVVTITATLSEQGEKSFTLKDKTLSYAVSNMPAYYDTDTVADMSLIESELRDLVNAEIGQMTRTNVLFGIGGYSTTWHYTEVEYVTSSKGYLLTLKDIKKDQYGSANAPFYNSIRVVADCYAHNDGSDGHRTGHIYVCFALNDVVVQPDGQIYWANKTYDITYVSKVDDSTIANEGVYRWSVCYNVQETEKTDWISISSNN